MFKVVDVGQRDGGKGKLIYEQPGSRKLHLQHPTTSLEEERPLQAGSNPMVDHYYEASRTTETQEKEKSGRIETSDSPATLPCRAYPRAGGSYMHK